MKPTSCTLFRIKKEYITSVGNTKDISLYIPSTGETIRGTSYGTIDHPNFTKLRDKLEQEGYIQTERTWWNGDRVLKPFILNNMLFKKGDQFPCATALSVKLMVMKNEQI